MELANELARKGLAASPVFHPSPAPSPQLSALPGGVLATFPKGWDEGRVEKWLASQQAGPGARLTGNSNVYVVPSGPGMQAIELVHRLERTGVLVECSPNWIQSATLR